MATGRKVLYFLGAGASHATGASVPIQGGGRLPIPVQATFWDVYLRLCASDTSRRTVETFLFRYFLGYRRAPSRLKSRERRRALSGIDVEEVFTFLSERVKAPSSSTQLKTYATKVWGALLHELGGVFSRFTPNTGTRRLIRRFHDRHVRSFDATVSFNYDTIYESSLPHTIRWHYAGVETDSDSYPVLKPHGSINWGIADQVIVVTSTPAAPVVVAPTHLKFVTTSDGHQDASGYLDQAPQIESVWRLMEKEMNAARLLVFIGYSFPLADLYFSSVLRSVLADRSGRPGVVVVNPDAVSITQRLQSRFALPHVVKFFDFAQFIDAGRDGVRKAVNALESA